MLRRVPTGTWFPAWVPESTAMLSVLLLVCSIVQSATGGYDGSMLNGLNILPSYTDYFKLNTATTGLNTASIFIGGFLAPIFTGVLCDRLGRRPTIFWGSALTLVGVILQSAAQDVAMFVIARIVLGFGEAMSGIAAGVYLSETFASRWRAWGVGLLNNFYYVGALIAAGITLGTSSWQSTWAWRAPSIFQGIFSFLCILIIPFIPESPRFLIHEGYFEEARLVIALANCNGDSSAPVTLAVYKEIMDTIAYEKGEGKSLSPMEMFKDRKVFKRTLIGASPGPISCVVGNIIASYYLGAELASAGITSSLQQLKANVVLNVWCLFCCLIGTHLCATMGRKSTALLSQFLLTVCLFIISGLTQKYSSDPDHASSGLVYGNVAVMFLFQGFYSIAWTPLLYLYPPEVLNYNIRANGVAFSQLVLNGLACCLVFVQPIGITNIGWKMYLANAIWDVALLILIWVYWVETKGLTLEEIDRIFDGVKHSNVSDVEAVRMGRAKVDVQALEAEFSEKETFGGTPHQHRQQSAETEREEDDMKR